MTKGDVVRLISDKTGIVREDIQVIIDSFFETVKESMRDGHHIEIRGFGTMKMRERKATTARNPKTGEKVDIPARIVPTFKFSKNFRDEVTKEI
ncbi:MAG: HU family DNA-binding protein [Candidatus Cloacimonadia bacterium]